MIMANAGKLSKKRSNAAVVTKYKQNHYCPVKI